MTGNYFCYFAEGTVLIKEALKLSALHLAEKIGFNSTTRTLVSVILITAFRLNKLFANEGGVNEEISQHLNASPKTRNKGSGCIKWQ